MRPTNRRAPAVLCSLLFLWAGSSPVAQAQNLTADDARRLHIAATTCTGDAVSGSNGQWKTIYAKDLPVLIDRYIATGAPRPDQQDAGELYRLASALLKPALAKTPKAMDPGGSAKCVPAPDLGVKLLAFLFGNGTGSGPITNIAFWLGEAHKQGIGVNANPTLARSYFLKARILGQGNLTAEDWGQQPTDRLEDVLQIPSNRAMLEAFAAFGHSESQLLLAEQIMKIEPKRALALFEAAAQPFRMRAVRRLAQIKMDGLLGQRDYDGAVSVLAPYAHNGQSRNGEYDKMLAAALAYNQPLGEIPNANRRISFEQLGGKRLLPGPGDITRDSLAGPVEAKALLGPDGKVKYVELLEPSLSQFTIGSGTLWIYQPYRLARVVPHVVDDRAVFAWIILPRIVWKISSVTPDIGQ